MSNPFTTKDPLFDIIKQVMLGEKKLTDDELKKREEIAKAMERDNPGMDMSKKMAIATDKAKEVAEEVEQIDEVGNTLKGQIGLRDYKEKAKKDMGDAGEKLWYKSVSDKDTKGKMALIRQRDKRRKGIQRADARIKTEEVNLDEQLENFWEAYTTMFNEAEDQQQNMLLRAMAKDPSDLMKMKRAIKMGDKALTNPALRQEILAMLDKMMHLTTGDPSLLQKTRAGFQKAKRLPEDVQIEEEVEQIDEAISHDSLVAHGDKKFKGWERTSVDHGKPGAAPHPDYHTGVSHTWVHPKSKQFFSMHHFDKNEHEAHVQVGHVTPKGKKVAEAEGFHHNRDVKAEMHQSHIENKDYMKKKNIKEEAEKAPFEGGREVKSKKSAAERVKKIALGKKKQYTPKKDKM